MDYIKKINKPILVAFYLSVFSSCFLTTKKNFTNYKLPINNNNLFFNGVYYSKEKNGIENACYFYRNGLVKFVEIRDTNVERYTKIDPKRKDYFIFDSKFVTNYDLTGRELWGAFYMIKDSIFIQTFGNCMDCGIKRDILEKKGTIKSNAIQLNPTYSYYDYHFFNDKASEYEFIPCIIKPDSTKAWFINKRWYKKGLHPSRK